MATIRLTIQTSKQKHKKVGSVQAIRSEIAEKIRNEQWANPQKTSSSTEQPMETKIQRPAPTLAAFIEEQRKRETGELQEAEPAVSSLMQSDVSKNAEPLTMLDSFATENDSQTVTDVEMNMEPGISAKEARPSIDAVAEQGLSDSTIPSIVAQPEPEDSAGLESNPLPAEESNAVKTVASSTNELLQESALYESDQVSMMEPDAEQKNIDHTEDQETVLSEAFHPSLEEISSSVSTEIADLSFSAANSITEQSMQSEQPIADETIVFAQAEDQPDTQDLPVQENCSTENSLNALESDADRLQEIRILELHPKEKNRKLRPNAVLRVERKE